MELREARSTFRAAMRANRAEYRQTVAQWRSSMRDVAEQATPAERERVREVRERVRALRAERFVNRCERYTNRTPVQAGFAAVYDPFSRAREQWMSVKCDPVSGDYTVEAGADDGDTYVYRYGYRWDNGWRRFELDTVDGERTGAWIRGKGFADFEPEITEAGDPAHVVTYLCKRVNDRWRCGCSDEQCTRPKWALQTLDPDDEFEELDTAIEESEEDDEITEEVDANEHDELIGMSEAEAADYASEQGVPFRVGSRDGEQLPLTMDYVVGRITADLVDGIVTDYTVE
jgi:hypothetical protein